MAEVSKQDAYLLFCVNPGLCQKSYRLCTLQIIQSMIESYNVAKTTKEEILL